MNRRDFLLMTGAVAVTQQRRAAVAAFPIEQLQAGRGVRGASVLYDDRVIRLATTQVDPRASDVLWVRKSDLPEINGFELKPQGACRADVCIPISKDMTRGEYFNLTAFARKIGQSVVVDSDAAVWSLGEIPVLRGSFLTSRMAPDFALADRKGRLVHLSDFRGKKVLVLTWASW